VAHTFNPSTWEAEAGGFGVQPGLQRSFRTARAILRNPVSKKKKKKKKRVPRQPVLQCHTLSQKNKQKNQPNKEGGKKKKKKKK
jgi:hypothetical protein